MWKIALLSLLLLTGCMNSGEKPAGTASEPSPGITAEPDHSGPDAAGKNSPGKEAPDNSDQTPEVDQPRLLDIAKLPHTFAFSDESGTRLLGYPAEKPDSMETVKQLNYAIGDNGNVVAVRFLNEQKYDDQDSGRQTARNFDHTAGMLFEITDGKAVPNESYYLVNDKDFPLDALAAIQPAEDYPAMDDALADKAAKQSGHQVELAAKLADIGGDKEFYFIKFKREGDQALASLVLKDGDTLAFKDFPAEYNESSTWRVDDGGEISPHVFSLMFAAESANGTVLGVKWLGFEGENQMLFMEDGQTLKELDISGGRYMSPE
ncbi:hypothetical protein [Paenibacillus nasutitermitis]|uniref:Lipoprotein n=1 Tax=Paenibacillus nasutitermitis TaxID=1652958 RepID=A0A916YYD3_9BACL|nr:hypothetical protein [Paenibacillus nasutitermitis]GGD67204.1 hypothetical protein GCM10010911_26230 [Paenibacillus nasutitermitis]